MPYFSVDPECVLGTTLDCIRFPEINPNVFGAVELTDEEVQQLVDLIRENDGETDVEELELEEEYPEIYRKLDDAYRAVACEAAYRAELVESCRNGDLYIPDNLIESLEAEQLFKFEVDPEDYSDKDGNLDPDYFDADGNMIEEAFKDLKREAFQEWLSDYTAELDDDELYDFIEHYYDLDLIDLGPIHPDYYIIEIPEKIVEMAKGG